MENLKKSPVTLSVIETVSGEWKPEKINMPYEQTDHRTLKFTIPIPAAQQKTLELHYTLLNIFTGSFSRYNRPVF